MRSVLDSLITKHAIVEHGVAFYGRHTALIPAVVKIDCKKIDP